MSFIGRLRRGFGLPHHRSKTSADSLPDRENTHGTCERKSVHREKTRFFISLRGEARAGEGRRQGTGRVTCDGPRKARSIKALGVLGAVSSASGREAMPR